MALEINPLQLYFDDATPETVALSLRNISTHPVRYKARLAKAFHQVFSVDQATGRIGRGETRVIKVKYKPPSKGDATLQIKYIEVNGEVNDDESIFERHKDKTKTDLVRLAFLDVTEDFNYATPQVSRNIPEETEVSVRSKWWKKQT